MNEKTPDHTEIKDPTAIKWYKEGFRFALNYIHAILPDENSNDLTKKAFEEFINSALETNIDPDYFANHPFSCPSGLCPGDIPGTCIQCPDGAITPINNQGKKL